MIIYRVILLADHGTRTMDDEVEELYRCQDVRLALDAAKQMVRLLTAYDARLLRRRYYSPPEPAAPPSVEEQVSAASAEALTAEALTAEHGGLRSTALPVVGIPVFKSFAEREAWTQAQRSPTAERPE
jgi:hypothetical protein